MLNSPEAITLIRDVGSGLDILPHVACPRNISKAKLFVVQQGTCKEVKWDIAEVRACQNKIFFS